MRAYPPFAAVLASLFLGVCSFGCSGTREPSAGTPDVATSEETAATPTVDPDAGCEPGCHYDCFGGPDDVICQEGKVWSTKNGPYPCCHSSDVPKDVCRGSVIATCKSGCGGVDPRYQACMRGKATTPSHIWSMLCGEGAPRTVGATCSRDDDCRPAVADQTLRCDLATNKCIATPRPAKPTGYGSSCDSPSGELPVVGESVVTRPTCPVCYVARDTKCIRTHCTLECQLDEDCPTDSVCVCLGAPSGPVRQVCLPKNDRTLEGRTSSIACP